MLLGGALVERGPGLAHPRRIIFRPRRPDRELGVRAGERHGNQRRIPSEQVATVDQDHDRRFEALGAMHGHHPHLVAVGIEVALHLVRRRTRSAPGKW